MLATLQTVLQKAQRGRYAVGAFNVANLEQIQAVLQAARAQRSPVIINTSERAIAYGNRQALAAIVRVLASVTPVPVVLNLDHGHSVKEAQACLAAGYTGIMFDGSRLPYAKNIAQTKRVVAFGKRRKIGVEGELGQVKYQFEINRDPSLAMTDPTQAADFVGRTGVVAFAVAIGNAHGPPQPHEHLHFPRLQQIRKVVHVPLVLHGASSTPPAAIKRAIRLGICKINIDTDSQETFTSAVRKTLRSQASLYDPRVYLAAGREAMQREVEKKMILFGSRRKA